MRLRTAAEPCILTVVFEQVAACMAAPISQSEPFTEEYLLLKSRVTTAVHYPLLTFAIDVDAASYSKHATHDQGRISSAGNGSTGRRGDQTIFIITILPTGSQPFSIIRVQRFARGIIIMDYRWLD